PRWGLRSAMQAAIVAGFIVMFIVAVFALWVNELIYLCLALFIYVSCKQQWILLETGGEESLFGYDFSQGYTSLERDAPPPPRQRRPNFFQRWLQRRAARKLQLTQDREAAHQRPMHELPANIHPQP